MIKKFLTYFKNQKFTQDTVYGSISQIILASSGLIINIIVGNHYYANGLGIFNQTLSYFLLISIIANFGINNSILKYTAEYRDNLSMLKNILSSALVINIFISFLILFLLFLLYYFWGNSFLNRDLHKSVLIVFFSIPFFVINKNFLAFLNGLRRMKEYYFFQSLRWLLIICFVMFSILINESIQFSIFSLLFAEVIVFLLLFYKLFKYISYRLKAISFIKTHVDFGYKTIFTSVIEEVSKSASILMIGYFLGNEPAGIYSFASSVALGVLIFPQVIQTNFNPIISNYYANKQIGLLQSLISKLRIISLKIMLPLNLLLIVIYPLIINIIMQKPEYKYSYLVFYILIIGISFRSFFSFATGTLSMAGLLKENFIRVTILMSINLILNILLIPTLGIEGAAISVSIQYILSIFLLNYFMKTKMHLSLFKNKLSIA